MRLKLKKRGIINALRHTFIFGINITNQPTIYHGRVGCSLTVVLGKIRVIILHY